MTWTLLVGGYLLLALAALAVFGRLVRTRRGLPTAPPLPVRQRRGALREGPCPVCWNHPVVYLTRTGQPNRRYHPACVPMSLVTVLNVDTEGLIKMGPIAVASVAEPTGEAWDINTHGRLVDTAEALTEPEGDAS